MGERDAISFLKEGIKYYSCIFKISVVNFAIKSIGYVLLYGTVEECGLLTHYTDLQIWEQTTLLIEITRENNLED
jgi:hypothetical protein